MPAIGLFLMGGIRRVGSFLASRSLLELICIALALFAAVQTIRVSAEKRHGAKVEKQLRKCSEGRQIDRRAYEQAQRDAQELNRRQVQQIQRKQEAITNEVKSDLNSRLERIRRELRQSAPGHPQGPGAGQAGPAPEGTPGEARLCLSPEERLRAAENEERHESLIEWVERQSQVR